MAIGGGGLLNHANQNKIQVNYQDVCFWKVLSTSTCTKDNPMPLNKIQRVWLADRASTDKHSIVIDFETVVTDFDHVAVDVRERRIQYAFRERRIPSSKASLCFWLQRV